MKILQLTTCGMKNISRDMTLTFANSTIENGIKKVNNVKGIFGFNGAGKTALITSVDFYKKVVLDPTYLLQSAVTKKLDKLLNKKVKQFSFSIIFDFKESTVIKHSIVIKHSNINNLYYIHDEDIALSAGRTLYDKYKSLVHKSNGNIDFIKDVRIFDSSIDYLKDADLNYSSIVSKVTSRIAEQKIKSNTKLSIGEKILLTLYANVGNIDVYLSNEDDHNNYIVDKTVVDELINNAEMLKEKRETWVDLYADDVIVPKAFFSRYEKDNKKLESFIKIFKPDIKEIYLDKSVDGDLYHVRKVFKYKDYNVEYEFESSGIKQLVKIFSYLAKCSNGSIVFVDEIDTNINSVYFSKLVLFFKNYGKGQLIFTTHNIEAMNVLKGQSRSILALGEDNKLDVWVGKGNKSPIRDYIDGFFPNSPMNVEDFDFVSIFFGE